MTKDISVIATRIQMIAGDLTDEIVKGHYPVGVRFPTEPELRLLFGVGRHTIREALKLLTEQGLIGRRRKTGTFVLSTSPVSPYVHSLRDLKGLLDFAESTRLEVKHIGRISSDSKLLTGFENVANGQWLRIAGLRIVRADQASLCWTEILVPEQLAPPRDKLLGTDKAIYEETMAHNGFRLEYVEQEVTATLLPPAMWEFFGIDTDTAALLVKRRYVAHTGETFEVSHNLYPANRYKIRNIIRQRA